MKKILLFVSAIFFAGHSFAQSASDWDSPLDITTDNNMTIVFPDETLSDYVGGFLMAFINGSPVSAPALVEITGASGAAVIGTDSNCSCDLAAPGDTISFAILIDGTVVVITDVNPPVVYVANGFKALGDEDDLSFSVDGDPVVLGCTDPLYLEYDSLANVSDYSCDTPVVEGCTDATACNYDPLANTSDFCDYVVRDCDSCVNGEVINGDIDNDGLCYEADTISGCTDETACNYDNSSTVNTDNGLCTYAADLDACATCSGEQNGSGVVVDNDADDDTVCDDDEIVGCQDNGLSLNEFLGEVNDLDGDSLRAFNFNENATDAGVCVPVIKGCTNPNATNFNDYDGDGESNELKGDPQIDVNTDNGSCTADGVSPWGPAADGLPTEETATYVTSNNMSVLFPIENDGAWDPTVTDIQDGAVIIAAYDTDRLTNDLLGYDEISNIVSAGAMTWDGTSQGMAIFGEDPTKGNGFDEGQEIIWIVLQDGVFYNATMGYVDEFDGTYDDGSFVAIKSITLTSNYYAGCTDPTYIEFNPQAIDDDGSCATLISVGCLDEDAINYAGPGANPKHNQANNLGNPFVENVSLNLNSGDKGSATGVAATFHDQSMCQDQVEGCMQYMANNYDSYATFNLDTECNYDLDGLVEYNIDPNGNSLDTTYKFGFVDQVGSDNVIFESDFDFANEFYNNGTIDTDEHVVDNFASVLEWIEDDEAADAQELADTVTAATERYDAVLAQYRDSVAYTLDSAAVAFAADELADSLELADTIFDATARYDAVLQQYRDSVAFTLDSAAVAFAADELADSLELADTVFAATERYDAVLQQYRDSVQFTLDSAQAAHEATLAFFYGSDMVNNHITPSALDFADGYHNGGEGLVGDLQDTLNYYRAPIVIDLQPQWNMVGYYLHHESPVVAQFEANYGGSSFDVAANINIVKNNRGSFYWPDFNFDGLKTLVPGQGYQVRVKDEAPSKAFVFHHAIDADAYRVLNPTVPAWAVEMDVEQHPNDIRTLVRVVNMLGQEVNPADQFKGEVLLYLYNDATVEKKLVK